MFAISTSFCLFSSQVDILVKRSGIWLARGAPRAICRGPVHPILYGFSLFPQKTENERKLEKTQLFKIPADRGLLECLLGAPGCSFSGSLKFEKDTFPKKGPDLKKRGISLYPMVLAQKSVPLIFAPPQNFQKKSEKCLKK